MDCLTSAIDIMIMEIRIVKKEIALLEKKVSRLEDSEKERNRGRRQRNRGYWIWPIKGEDRIIRMRNRKHCIAKTNSQRHGGGDS